jgi:hypothetical protein
VVPTLVSCMVVNPYCLTRIGAESVTEVSVLRFCASEGMPVAGPPDVRNYGT